jgi:hypothetical protein
MRTCAVSMIAVQFNVQLTRVSGGQ